MPPTSKLNFRFHNPNPPEVAAEYISKIFVHVNLKKLDRLLLEQADNHEWERNDEKSRNVS